jgi:hypothetical protein
MKKLKTRKYYGVMVMYKGEGMLVEKNGCPHLYRDIDWAEKLREKMQERHKVKYVIVDVKIAGPTRR